MAIIQCPKCGCPLARCDIRQVISRRSDLSTFAVHLTRDTSGGSARDALLSILCQGMIEARSPLGQAVTKLRKANISLSSQNCVCFTETPLEHLSLLTQPIDGRDFQFKPYGIAITRVVARRRKANPDLPGRFLVICPESDFATAQDALGVTFSVPAFIDPSWGLEQIIGRLAGFDTVDIDVY